MAKALEYIEEHLCDPVGVDDVAQAVHVSPYHFHRLFSALTGEPLMAHVRRRRLAFAAAELRNPERTIQDIAFDCQFSSQAAFTRAFQQAFGVPPGRYRRAGSLPLAPTGRTFEPRNEVIALARIVQGDGFTFIGLPLRDLEAGENNSTRIAALWQEFWPRIPELGPYPRFSYGVCIPGQGSRFDYLAALAVDRSTPVPDGMARVEVPAQSYATFEHAGPPSRIPETYRHIFSEGLAAVGAEYRADLPDMEVYVEDPKGQGGPESIEIWIPIRSRAS